jgi:hypothetical protein
MPALVLRMPMPSYADQYICDEIFVIELGQQVYKKNLPFCVDSKNANLPL